MLWGMIEFSEENPSQAKEGITTLINLVWDEIGHGSMASQKPNPNFETYHKLHSADLLHIAIARKSDSIVGYATLLIVDLMQHMGTKCCFVDSVFLMKEHRKGLTGYKFLKFVADCGRKKGAKRIEWGVTIRNDFGHVLERMGYALESKRYGGDL